MNCEFKLPKEILFGCGERRRCRSQALYAGIRRLQALC